MNGKIKPTDAAYLAGLMDGEGCVTIAKSRSENTPIKTQYALRVEFVMCDLGPIQVIADIMGRPVKEKKLPSGRTAYKIWLSSSRAADFLRIVLPYLRGKRDQAELGIHFSDFIRPGRGKQYTEETIAMVESARERMKDLKRPHLLRC